VKIKEIKRKVKGDRRKMKLVRSYEKDFKKVKDLEGKDREFMMSLDEIKNFPDDLREVMLESLDKKITQFAEQILGGA